MDEIKSPIEKPGRVFNLLTSIWIVPLVALLVALWLVWQHFARLGPEIEIKFTSSGGLSVGQSVVRFRDVPVGKVTHIRIDSDGDGVVVTVRMQKSASSYLNASTRFWIVKPEVSYTGVKGLDTLFSGSYIAMYAKKMEGSRESFTGQETAYRDINEGSYYMVQGSSSNNLVAGTPVNYKNIQVGQVEQMLLDPDGEHVNMVLFIEKKYDYLINASTRFWVDDLFNFDLGAGKARFRMAPLSNLILGGISFETRFDKKYPPLPPKHFFTLYPSRSMAQSMILEGTPDYSSFIFVFEGDIAGLRRGVPIRYMGFPVGEITSISPSYDSKRRTVVSRVEGRIDTRAFADGKISGRDNMAAAIEDGLRARVVLSNFLTGASEVELYHSTVKPSGPSRIEWNEAVVIPADPSKSGNIMKSFADISSKTDKLLGSLQDFLNENRSVTSSILRELNATVADVRSFTSSDSFAAFPDKMSKTLKEFDRTLRVLKRTIRGYGPGSLFGAKLEQTLRELHESADQTNMLLRKLNKKPNSLIFGD